MKLKPDLLLHPNIPKPLHGTAPRVIKGDVWWDEQRQIAYKKNDFRCWACGVHKLEAEYHQWLEAHEIYEVDYSIGEVKFNGICALCHTCHNFIHSGRLSAMYNKKEVKFAKAKHILLYGCEVLRQAKLPMNPFALKVLKDLDPKSFDKYIKYPVYDYGMCLAEWGDWHMIIDNKRYKGKFKSQTQWEKFYGN